MKALRDAFGEALVELGSEYPNLVVLDADLSKATRTCYFAEAFPERFFNMGISECNMMGVAAGMALTGQIPFVATFAVFAPGRTLDQIRNTICYSKLNVKIVGSNAGLSGGEDGGSHQAVEDLAVMRSLPGMKVFIPADALETKTMVRRALEIKGPVYIRIPRGEMEEVFDSTHQHEDGIEILRQGEDAVILACGPMLAEGLKAAEVLEKEGIKCIVANVHTLKPLDEEKLIKLAEQTGCVVTVEDHSIYGGLGGAVAEVLSENRPVPLRRIGVRDQFGQSGSAQVLYKEYGLTANDIAMTVKEVIRMSKR